MSRLFSLLAICLFLVSCRPETYVPKPRGYFIVDLPVHEYQVFDDPNFPYKFEYPVYARIIKDTTFFGEKPENPYWMNMDIPSMGGRVYISYKKISQAMPYYKLVEDAYEMTQFHTKKADNISPYVFNRIDSRVYGELYSVTGNAASAYQFYASDSAKHFIRGALYFDVAPNPDSLKPMNEFLREDLEHMLETLEWKN